jgi:uncharacterized cupin superfamily protein
MGHAIVNLRELPDFAERAGYSETQEARFARQDLGTEALGVSLQRVKPGKRHAFGHRHKADEEIYVVVAGGGRVKLDDEVLDVGLFDAIRVAPEVGRAFEAGPDGLELLAFGTHHEDDPEVLPEFWSD